MHLRTNLLAAHCFATTDPIPIKPPDRSASKPPILGKTPALSIFLLFVFVLLFLLRAGARRLRTSAARRFVLLLHWPRGAFLTTAANFTAQDEDEGHRQQNWEDEPFKENAPKPPRHELSPC